MTKKKTSARVGKKAWKTSQNADGSWSIYDDKGVERFLGGSNEVIIVYLCEYMRLLEAANKKIARQKKKIKQTKEKWNSYFDQDGLGGKSMMLWK